MGLCGKELRVKKECIENSKNSSITFQDDMPTKEEVEELIAFCEALADDEKRDDDFDEDDLEEVCRELAKMLVSCQIIYLLFAI